MLWDCGFYRLCLGFISEGINFLCFKDDVIWEWDVKMKLVKEVFFRRIGLGF